MNCGFPNSDPSYFSIIEPKCSTVDYSFGGQFIVPVPLMSFTDFGVNGLDSAESGGGHY